jgi:hypothetical protein
MTSSARNILAFLLIALSSTTVLADEQVYRWGYYWDESTYLGKCYPSIKSYVEGNEEMKVYNAIGDKKRVYFLVTDSTPTKNQPWIWFRKESKNKYCIILLHPGGNGGGELTINKDGSLPDTFEIGISPSGLSPSTSIIYHFNLENGFYEPKECAWEWLFAAEGIKRTQHFSCDTNEEAPVWIPVADTSDCSKVLTEIEKSICGDTKLTALDYTLSSNYELIKSAATDAQNTQLTIDQEEWLKQRNTCRNNECIVSAYLSRIDEICTKYAVSLLRPFDCVRSGYIQFKK